MIDGQKLVYALQIIIDIESAYQELDLALSRVNTITSRIENKMDHLTKCLIKSGLNDSLIYGNAIYCILEDGRVERSPHNSELDVAPDNQSDNVGNF